MDIGNLTELYYYLFIVLSSMPFVLVCFLLVRFVVPLSLKDVLHLSFYPIGAGVFAGAVFTLVAAVVVRLLVDVGYIPEVKLDLAQWGGQEQIEAVLKHALYDCLKQASLLFSIVAAGFEEPYGQLKPPIDFLSYLRPGVTVLYLVIAACFFTAAVKRHKLLVFGLVLLAAVLATGAIWLATSTYVQWSSDNSDCSRDLVARGFQSYGPSALKAMAQYIQEGAKDNPIWQISVQTEGRNIRYTYRYKRPIDIASFEAYVSQHQKDLLNSHCSQEDDLVIKVLKGTETHTYYNPDGERLMSFSISPADCPQH
ncbi:MAG: hypothetical protein ACRD3W_00840 [Terriglobales bacterium]